MHYIGKDFMSVPHPPEAVNIERKRGEKVSAKKIESLIRANGVDISVITTVGSEEDYISLTDMARHVNPSAPKDVVKNWIRLRGTIDFLGLWERLNNPDFKGVESDAFKSQAGTNAFTLSPQQWIKATNAIGLISKSGRYGGGTFAHKDIAFEFASWISPEFKLYIIKDYQRLKQDEGHRLALDWNVNRVLAKTNYRIHTDAVKANLIPPELSKEQQRFVYADEADVLNVALFGQTAREWKAQNQQADGNMRDYATIEQLLVLVNLEAMNALLIEQGRSQEERAKTLNAQAIALMRKLSADKGVRDLQQLHDNPRLPDK